MNSIKEYNRDLRSANRGLYENKIYPHIATLDRLWSNYRRIAWARTLEENSLAQRVVDEQRDKKREQIRRKNELRDFEPILNLPT